jgi:oligosaccharide repeat unit polymerase
MDLINQRAPGIWWLSPAFVVATAGIFISVAAYAIPDSTYRQYWRMPKFFDLKGLEVTLACVAVFVFGALLSKVFMSRVGRTRAAVDPAACVPWHLVRLLFRISFYLCLLGYALWIGLAIQRGMTLSNALEVVAGEKGAMYDARFTYLPTVGGVTTLTQFGTAAMILGAMLGFGQGWKGVRGKLAVIIVLALCRALLNSERFALIELTVPFLVASLALRPRFGRRTTIALKLAPPVAIFCLFVLFTGFEYFRSWTNYYAGRDLSLWEFGAMRLLGYYVTSFNNGTYFLHRLDPLNAPYFTLHFLWGFPLTSPLIKRFFTDPLLESTDKWFYFPFLEADANVEFNNADGMLFPLMDYGIAGGLLYWFVIGIVCGLIYTAYQRRDFVGLLLYPMTYLGLLELPLALYWGEGRAFPSLALLAATPLAWRFYRQYVWRTRPIPTGSIVAEAP